MGVAIPQVVTSDRASGAQVIDGSLKFDSSKNQFLQQTFGADGNKKTFTYSFWAKKTLQSQSGGIIFSGDNNVDGNNFEFRDAADKLRVYSYQNNSAVDYRTAAEYRDTSGWKHFVVSIDSTNGTASDRMKLYINGERVTNFSTSTGTWGSNTDYKVNTSGENHYIGLLLNSSGAQSTWFDGQMSQWYFIDGQALGPENFGFTDGLTNTWKPKKYEGTFGTNGFYLPMDGNSPIGQDQSGQGNNWTPVNFGGSVALDNPQVSGARPILNTTQGGTQAGVGVFGSRQNVGYAVTVYNDGGGNKYYIDGVKQDTVTGLIRGATYTFDTSDSTVSSHPFRFSATSNGSHGGGSEYTNGVAAITGAATTITVPHDAPNTLYYYCTSHSGMGADITGITTNEKLADQYASNIVFASPLVGVNNDVSASIACTSSTKSVTSNGDAAASSDKSNFYAGSFEFDGTGDYLNLDIGSGGLGDGDFTIEFWSNSDTTSGSRGQFQLSPTSGGLKAGAGTALAVYQETSASSYRMYVNDNASGNSTSATDSNKWNHFAVVRSGSTQKLYMNGIEEISASSTIDYTTARYLCIGGYYSTSYLWDGYIQDFRVYKGVAKYTSNFVPAAASPDILPDTPSGVSGGSKLAKITEGAVSFDGTNDSVSIADHADFTFGSGDFTLEAFVYNRSSGYRSIVMKYGGSPAASSWFWSMYNGQNQFYYYSGSNEPAVTSGQTHYNKWVHCAVSREGNTIRLFDNGELTGTLDVSSYDTMNDSTVPLDIGADYADNYDMDGFISNVRIVKGTALYTKRFTPPSAPLTNVTNTKLLCCQSNSEGPQKTAVIPSVTGTATAMWPLDSDINDDSGNSNTLTENGGSTSFTSAGTNPFGLSNCADFAADGKYLSYAVTPASAWTIDGYIKFDDVSSGSNSYVLGWNGTDGSDTTIGLTKSNSTFTVWGSSNLSTTTVAVVGRWYHVRLTTSGTSDLALYVDGVLAGRSTSSDGSPASPITIGDMQSGRFNGQIAGVRYTPTDLGAPPLGGETTSSGVTSNSPSVGVGLAGNVAATNFNPFNTDINTVRGQETGYATLNPLDLDTNASLSNGNLTVSSTTNAWNGVRCTTEFPSSGGKWYFEVLYVSGTYFNVGIDVPGTGAVGDLSGANSVILYEDNGTVRYNNQGTLGTISTTIDPGMTFGVAVDHDNKSIKFYINNVLTHSTTYTTPTVPAVSGYGTWSGDVNFGQKPFKFPPPDGFLPLNTANTRPVKVISRPDQYVGITTWTGDGGSSRTIDLPLSGDLVWAKKRNEVQSHQLADTVRGNNSVLKSNNTDAAEDPVTDFTGGGITSINSTSFTISQGTSNNDNLNESDDTFVAWTWKAGGSKNTFNVDDVGYASAAAAGLDGGTITPTGASVGTRSGFSILKWTGTSGNGTLSHGLTEAPNFVIVKANYSPANWPCYHSGLTDATKYIWLNSTSGENTQTAAWNSTAPTSNLFHVGGEAEVNRNGFTSIAYLWHDVPGLQKFGSYEGNQSTDGPFVELGFQPAIIWLKNADDGTNRHWCVVDATRTKINKSASAEVLFLDDTQVESYANNNYGQFGTKPCVDILSNGFKVREGDTSGVYTQTNRSNTIIYCAWAAAPTVDLFGGGANAR